MSPEEVESLKTEKKSLNVIGSIEEIDRSIVVMITKHAYHIPVTLWLHQGELVWYRVTHI